jgi:PTH1 family peptidyl-tRNA hydrolase
MTEEKKEYPLKPIRLIVGLGNPGSAYSGNRHNIGFMVIDRLIEHYGVKVRKRCQSELAQVDPPGPLIFLQKPQTFMNCSGDAVKKFCRREKISPAEILVIYDDLDLKPGRLRIRFGGGAGGHNGIRSLTARMGTPDYGRLRLGIGRPASSAMVSDYVLQDFAQCEKELIDEVVAAAAEAVLMLCDKGYEAAMNVFNGSAVERCSNQPNQE